MKKPWRPLMLFAGDFLLANLALGGALILRHSKVVSNDYYLLHEASFAALFIIWQVAFYAMGLYDMRRMREIVFIIRNLLMVAAVNWVIGTMYFYIFASDFGIIITPKTHLLLTLVFFHAAALLWRKAWINLIQSGALVQKVLFLGDDKHVRELQGDFQHTPELGYVLAQGRDPQADLIVADSRWVEEHWDDAKMIMGAAMRRRVPIVTLENFYESILGKVSPDHAGDTAWIIEFILSGQNTTYLRLRRLADIMVAGFLFLCLFPMLLVIAALIRFVDKMSPFYGQKRLGLMGNQFMLWKFRTMVPTADASGPFTSAREKDPRITALGNFLRRFRLDELPQLWNVLCAQMSLVGPRPEWLLEIEILERVVPHYHLRHLVPPGMTGWAQVNFKATNNTTDSLEKLRYDLYYVKNVSLALDISILLKTAKRIFVNDVLVPSRPQTEGASGPGEDPKVLDFGSLIGRN